MLKVVTNVSNLENLNKYIDYVNKMANMKTDKDFQKYIQDKCLKTVQKVARERVHGSTNDDALGTYINSNHIIEIDGGFVLYNDAKIPAEVYGVQNDISNYVGGMFNLALAFEYGVGIIGQNTPTQPKGNWNYNVQGYNFGWKLPQSVTGEVGVETAGYQGFEVYRFTAEEIKAQLPKWVKDYYKTKEV